MDNETFKEKQKFLGLNNMGMAAQLGYSIKHLEQLRSGYKSIPKHTEILVSIQKFLLKHSAQIKMPLI